MDAVDKLGIEVRAKKLINVSNLLSLFSFMSNRLQMESENNLQLGRQLLAQGPGVVKALNKVWIEI